MDEGAQNKMQEARDSWAFSKYVDSFAIKEYTSMIQDNRIEMDHTEEEVKAKCKSSRVFLDEYGLKD